MANRNPQPKQDAITVVAGGPTGLGNVLQNDSDKDGDALAVIGFSTEAGLAGILGLPLEGKFGALTVRPDGDFTYNADPTLDAVKKLGAGKTALDKFTISISDGHGGTATETLTVTVTGVNDAPTAVDDAKAVNEGSAWSPARCSPTTPTPTPMPGTSSASPWSTATTGLARPSRGPIRVLKKCRARL